MAHYVDSFVLPVRILKLATYLKLERKFGKICVEHGALSYSVAMADDVKLGKHTSFPQSVKLKDDEAVVVAWVTYKSRRHRDQVVAKVMADERLQALGGLGANGKDGDKPFDGKRMFWGGFKTIVTITA